MLLNFPALLLNFPAVLSSGSLIPLGQAGITIRLQIKLIRGVKIRKKKHFQSFELEPQTAALSGQPWLLFLAQN